ncbi:MAG: hypothetical protein OXO50_18495 [Caldilineaceae bacterium]|nr:hypothetical protein [Caldilineaceae bacterium]
MTKIDNVVKQVVQQQLAPARIIGLTVEESEDADGDPILRIKVIFEAKEDRLDPERVLGLIRHLRKSLNELGSNRFPVFSFMTSEEAEDATA